MKIFILKNAEFSNAGSFLAKPCKRHIYTKNPSVIYFLTFNHQITCNADHNAFQIVEHHSRQTCVYIF